MPPHLPALKPLAAERSAGLQGVLRLPGDRLLSHLALILGTIARGETTIEGLQESADVFATGRAMQAFGARILKHGERWHVAGVGVGGLLEPPEPLYFSSSTTALRLVMGLAGPLDFVLEATGDARLSARPESALLAALADFGTGQVGEPRDRLPLRLRGPRLPTPAELKLAAPSFVNKAAALLAALGVTGVSSISEPLRTIDHAEALLQAFGARLTIADEGPGRRIEIEGYPMLRARPLAIPGDISLAAAMLVAASIVPDSEVLIEDVLVSPGRLTLVATLRDMGAEIDLVRERRPEHSEPVADIRVRHAPLRGIDLPAERLAMLADEFPLLAVAAAAAEGDSSFEGLDALADRDSDQVAALLLGFAANGVAARRAEDRLVIEGRGRIRGRGRVTTHGDAALAMAFLVLGMAAEEQVTVDDQSSIAQIYPGFVADFEALGARFLRFS